MERFILIMLVVLGSFGCDRLTEPDEDQMKPVLSAIQDLPPGVRNFLEHELDFRTLEIMKEQNPDRPVADIRCGPMDEVQSQLTIRQMYSYMKDFMDAISGGSSAYNRNVAKMSFGEYLNSKLSEHGCRADFLPYADFAPDFAEEDPPQKSNRQIADFLIAMSALEMSRRPWLMDALGLHVAAGGVIIALDGIGLLLCPLSDDIACPNDPGGDRR